MRSIRHDLHAHPELAFDEHRTARVIAKDLRRLGIEVTTGIGGTGVVGVVRGPEGGPVVGLRAEMDALPITELPHHAHRSVTAGVMHACGHDGHVAMLLGAARLLVEDDGRRCPGTVVLVFQPAEEGEAGAAAMIRDGLITRFGVEEIYALHNIPGIPAGEFAIGSGPVMASFDLLDICITASGAHASAPHLSGDVIVAGSYLVTELQAIIARRTDPLEPTVLSIASFSAGTAHNVMPTIARLQGTVRTLSPTVRTVIARQIQATCDAISGSHNVAIEFRFENRYPPTVNDEICAARAYDVALRVAGDDRVDGGHRGILAAEDFAFMLEEKPGAYVFIGNGPMTDDYGPLHSPLYRFNDDILMSGARFLDGIARRSIRDLIDRTH